MINQVPAWISPLFLLAFAIIIVGFYLSNGRPLALTIGILVWSLVHGALAANGFYEVTDAMPPRFGLVLPPATLLIILGAVNRQLLARRNRFWSTTLHTIRLPIEIVLHALFLQALLPELMTFEGRNFDIIMGITAPIVAFLIAKNKISNTALLAWNILGLILILFILVNGTLSAELPFQQFAFDQPNKAILYFPYILLPATIVPIVVFTHVTDIILLWRERK
ncbi:MAG: hypothetical protein AAGI23_21305 [Bacteroidota bacterium]